MDTALTGASGHIGGNLARMILEEGRRVRVLARGDRRAIEDLDVETVTGDVLDPDSLTRLCDGVETVFHLAGRISLTGSDGGMVEKVNIEGTRNVIEACLRCGVRRLVHFSSIHAYRSTSSEETTDENSELALGSGEFTYDRSKAISQLDVVRSVDRGLHAVVINPTAVLGPHDHKPSRMGETLINIYRNRYPALVDGGYDWVDARDVSACALAAERKGRPGEAYLAGGHWRHVCDISRIISEMYGIKTPTFATPMWLCVFPAHVVCAVSRLMEKSPNFTPYALKTVRSHRSISHEKATRELGYSPRPIEDSIRDTIEWFRSAGMITDH